MIKIRSKGLYTVAFLIYSSVKFQNWQKKWLNYEDSMVVSSASIYKFAILGKYIIAADKRF